jgi:hypothetical protein
MVGMAERMVDGIAEMMVKGTMMGMDESMVEVTGGGDD